MIKVKPFLFTFCLLLGLMADPDQAIAHAMETNYQLNADSLEIQAVFGNGEVLPNAPVRIYSPHDPTQPWLEASTDDEGKFAFNPDQTLSGDWSVEIGEDSHWDQLIVPVSNSGIDLDAISNFEAPSNHHHFRLASQFVVVLIALMSGLGGRWLARKINH